MVAGGQEPHGGCCVGVPTGELQRQLIPQLLVGLGVGVEWDRSQGGRSPRGGGKPRGRRGTEEVEGWDQPQVKGGRWGRVSAPLDRDLASHRPGGAVNGPDPLEEVVGLGEGRNAFVTGHLRGQHVRAARDTPRPPPLLALVQPQEPSEPPTPNSAPGPHSPSAPSVLAAACGERARYRPAHRGSPRPQPRPWPRSPLPHRAAGRRGPGLGRFAGSCAGHGGGVGVL